MTRRSKDKSLTSCVFNAVGIPDLEPTHRLFTVCTARGGNITDCCRQTAEQVIAKKGKPFLRGWIESVPPAQRIAVKEALSRNPFNR